MISNKTYSYPYSTHKRYPFSVCRKLLLDSTRMVDYTALRLAKRSVIERASLKTSGNVGLPNMCTS
jgi:hypothetical protein